MDKKLEESLSRVETSYHDLVAIAEDITAPRFAAINDLVKTLNAQINALSVEQIRNYILELQLKAFELSEIKEKAALKAELAEAIQKEQFAISFNGMDGSAAVKDKLAIVENAPEVVSEALYNLIANLFRTKLDQMHRLVAALTSILTSRMQEAKFMNLGVSSEIPPLQGKAYINK